MRSDTACKRINQLIDFGRLRPIPSRARSRGTHVDSLKAKYRSPKPVDTGSRPVRRTTIRKDNVTSYGSVIFPHHQPVDRRGDFPYSTPRLSIMPRWRNGRRIRLKPGFPEGSEGSNPSWGTLSGKSPDGSAPPQIYGGISRPRAKTRLNLTEWLIGSRYDINENQLNSF